MGPEIAQGIVGVAKAIKAGNAIKGVAKNVSKNLKKWYAPSKPKKSHFKKVAPKAAAPAPAPTTPAPTPKPVK